MGEANPVTSVYQYHDERGHILYVGVTARGIRRSHEHAETKVWWPLCTGCAIEHYETRDAALTREKELIQRHSPPFNTVHNSFRDASREAYEQTAPGRKARDVRKGTEAKRRTAEWYALSPTEKLVAPCVQCGERPGLHGPRCATCKPKVLVRQTVRR